MRFNICLLFIITFTACASSTPTKTGTGKIGETLSKTSSLYHYNDYGSDSNVLFTVDEPSSRIFKLDLDEMKIQESYNYTNSSEDHYVYAGKDNNYVLDFCLKHLTAFKSADVQEEIDFEFQGKPISAAFNAEEGILVMEDDLRSIQLTTFTDDGAVKKSWVGGPLFEEDKSLVAGDIDKAGHLVISVSDDSLLIVDVDGTIKYKSWQYTAVDSTLKGIDWIAPDYRNDSLMLAKSSTGIAVIDVEGKTISDSITLADKNWKIIGESKLTAPHILAQDRNTGFVIVVYVNADGKLESKIISDLKKINDTDSYLNSDASELSVLISRASKQRVYKVRLSDALVTLNKSFDEKGKAVLGPGKLFIDKESQLGFLQSIDLDSGKIRELRGYNFDYFRK